MLLTLLIACANVAGADVRAMDLALTRIVRAAGGAGSAFDTPGWQAFAVPVLIVVCVGVFATWIPVRRALSVDPAVVLRME